MSLDLEMFLREAIEKAIEANPEYANIRVSDLALSVDNGTVTLKEVERY